MKRGLIVAALVCLSGITGFWLRGLLDAPSDERPRPHRADPTARTPETPRPMPPAASQATDGGPRAADPYDALRGAGSREETPTNRLARVFGDDVERATTLLPELLARARSEMDERRTRTVLELMVATGDPGLLAVVLDAMVSDDLAFDFAHRDDVFRDMLLGVASEDVGEAALRRLGWEFSRGETSDGQIGGYAVLVGASRIPAGRAFLQEMFDGKQGGGGSARSAAARGLAATGDAATMEQLVRLDELREDHFEVFLGRTGPAGWETLERIAAAPEMRGRETAEVLAQLSARQKRPETGALLERLWHGGARRAALAGCAGLRPGTLPEDAEERLREMVFRAILDEPDSGARRGAFYAIEYSQVFQTDRAHALLEGIVAGGGPWANDARDALRATEKTLRRAAATSRR